MLTDENLLAEDNLDTTVSETSETADEAEEENSQTDEQEEEIVDPKELRHAQQQEWAKKEVERLRNIAIDTAYKAVKVDAWALLELHEVDPKLAKEVARKFWYNSYEDAIKTLDPKWDEETSQTLTEDQFEKMYQRRRKEEEHISSLKKAEKIISKITDNDLREQAQAQFEELVGNKKLDEDEAIKFADMATYYVSKGKLKWEKKDEAAAKFASTWISPSKKSNSQEPTTVVRNGKLILLDSNNN